MAGFELPGLEPLNNEESIKERAPDEGSFNSEGLDREDPLLIPVDEFEEENIIDLEDEEEEDDTVAQFEDITGKIIDVKINRDRTLTAVKLQRDNGSLVLLQEEEANYTLKKGDYVSASVDSESATKTKSGLYSLLAISIMTLSREDERLTPASPPIEKDEIPKSIGSSKRGGIKSLWTQALDELKGNKGKGKQPEEPYSEEQKNKEKKPRGAVKKKKNIYLTVANSLYSLLSKPISLIKKVPVLGKIAPLLDTLVRCVTYLWGVILVLIVALFLIPMGNSGPAKEKASGQEVKADNITLDIQKTSLSGQVLTLEGKNLSDVYADTYMSATVKTKGLNPFRKKAKCEGPYTNIAPKNSFSVKLKCDISIENGSIKTIELHNDN